MDKPNLNSFIYKMIPFWRILFCCWSESTLFILIGYLYSTTHRKLFIFMLLLKGALTVKYGMESKEGESTGDARSDREQTTRRSAGWSSLCFRSLLSTRRPVCFNNSFLQKMHVQGSFQAYFSSNSLYRFREHLAWWWDAHSEKDSCHVSIWWLFPPEALSLEHQ